MPGPYYCNGKKEDCCNTEKCYKNGGRCYHTKDYNYIAKGKPYDVIRNVWGEQKKHKYNGFPQCNEDKYDIFSGCVFTAVVSFIVSFVTTLITILAITL